MKDLGDVSDHSRTPDRRGDAVDLPAHSVRRLLDPCIGRFHGAGELCGVTAAGLNALRRCCDSPAIDGKLSHN